MPTKVNLNAIRTAQLIAVHNAGEYPDNVMIHPSNKRFLAEEVFGVRYNIDPFKNCHTCFGMRIIWTCEICEHEVICTYNAK